MRSRRSVPGSAPRKPGTRSTWRTARSRLLASHRGIFRFWYKSAGCPCCGERRRRHWVEPGRQHICSNEEPVQLVCAVPAVGSIAHDSSPWGKGWRCRCQRVTAESQGGHSQRDLGEGNKAARRAKPHSWSARQSALPARGRAAFSRVRMRGSPRSTLGPHTAHEVLQMTSDPSWR